VIRFLCPKTQLFTEGNEGNEVVKARKQPWQRPSFSLLPSVKIGCSFGCPAFPVIRFRCRFSFVCCALVSFVLAGSPFASAQSVIAPPAPEFSTTPSQLYGFGNNTNRVVTPETTTATPMQPGQEGPLDWGQIHLRPHLLYRISYGNGIQARPGDSKNTLINELDPGILIGMGDHWHLDYTPTLRFYSSRSFQDEVNQAVNLAGATMFEDWSFSLSQGYVSSSSPLIETGIQTEQETYATAFTAAYQVNSDVSLDLSLNQNFRYATSLNTNQPLTDSKNWSATLGLNYLLWPGLSVGLSGVFGYDHLEVGPDMTSEQLLGRLNWHPGQKFTLSLNGGFEDRQFLNTSVPDAFNPILHLTLIYQPFEVTTLSLDAHSTVNVSYFQNQITEATGFSLSLRQRLFGKLFLDVTGGYGNTKYQPTTVFIPVNRQDDRANINIRLTCPLFKKATAALFYDWTDNSSSQNGFQYTSNQGGLELGYRF
jgi:hypothetical protein